MLVVLFRVLSRYSVVHSFRLIVLFHRLCEGSARGNWDPREGQQPFRLNSNGVGYRTTTLRRLLIGGAFFLRPLLIYALPGWFPFLSITNITKLERLYWAASRAISGCLLSSPIPLLLSEVFLSFLRVTLTHLAMSSYDRTLRLPTSFSILDLARIEVKPRLCRSSWRAVASTHPLVLSSTSPRETLFACPSSLSWYLLSFTVESTLSSPSSRSISPRYDSRSSWFSPTSWSGILDRPLCSFFNLAKATWSTCLLLSLLH